LVWGLIKSNVAVGNMNNNANPTNANTK
jgi:hypothetical protein